MAEKDDENQICGGKTVTNEMLKGQVPKAKRGRSSQKIEGGEEEVV